MASSPGGGSGADPADDLELEAHRQAFLRIFQSVLKKKGASAEQARPLLQKLRAFVYGNRIQSPDDLLAHLSDYARALQVPPPALQKFIGQNLLLAVETVKKELRKREAENDVGGGANGSRGGAHVSDAQVARSVLAELLRQVGTLVTPPDRFENLEMGLMKLLRSGEEVLPQSAVGQAQASGGAASSEESAGGSAAATATATATAASRTASATASPAAEAAPAARQAPTGLQKETSIIQEILNRYGADLDVPYKLESDPFRELREGQAAASSSAASSPAGAATSAGAASSNGASSEMSAGRTVRGEATDGGTPTAPSPGASSAASRAAPGYDEPSIIAEILERYGEELIIPGKLEPSDGLGDASQIAGQPLASGDANAGGAGGVSGGSAHTGDPGGDQAAGAERGFDPPPEIEPIPLTFEGYIEITRRIGEFQKRGDSAGYREWLAEQGDPAKALVGLRNLQARQRRGEADFHWDDEVYNLAAYMDLKQEQLQEFCDRIRRYEKLQQLMNQFVSSVKQKQAPVVQAVKTIWPQVKLIFSDEDWDAESMLSRLKIPLLQISDPKLKDHVAGLFRPLFERAERLAHGRE